MRVIKDNFNSNSYPKEAVCDYCESRLSYEKKDCYIGEFGCVHILCPLCGHEILLDNEESLKLTTENIEFPEHFSHTSSESAVNIPDSEVTKYIKEHINYLENHPDEEYSGGHIIGNLYVMVTRVDEHETGDNYCVSVSKDFYETYMS